MSNQPPNPFADDEISPYSKVHEYNPFAQQEGSQSTTGGNNNNNNPPPPLEFQDYSQDNQGNNNSNNIGSPSNSNKIQPDMHDVNINEEFSSGGFNAPPPSNNSDTKQVPLEQFDQQKNEGEDYSFFQLGYYQRLFNVDTVDVLDRTFRSVVPFRRNFFPTIKPNPDLYGPFWIAATLVFVMAASGNFESYLSHLASGTLNLWKYEFSKLPWGAAVVYGYVGIIPLGAWLILSWIDDFDISLIQFWCLYGYSMFIYVPAAIVSAIPIDYVRFIAVGIACGISTFHIFLSMVPQLAPKNKTSFIILLVLLALHVGLAFAFIFYFFSYKDNINQTPVGPVAPPVAPVAPTPVAATTTGGI